MPLELSPNVCLAYLIRHGATDNNLADPPLLQGRSADGSLSAAGQQQAELAGRHLAQHGLQAVYCSPLKRARETAEFVARVHGLTPEIVDDITEVDVGAWEGRNWQEIEKTDGERYRQFMEHPDTVGYLDGESLEDVRARVVPAIDELLARHPGQRIAIVAHNVVNRVYLATAMNLPLSRARGLSQDNGGINVLRWKDDAAKLVSMNSVFHLHETS